MRGRPSCLQRQGIQMLPREESNHKSTPSNYDEADVLTKSNLKTNVTEGLDVSLSKSTGFPKGRFSSSESYLSLYCLMAVDSAALVDGFTPLEST
ncbi:hypothetical protein Tco_0621106 [Tanacetum coccineum]